jgi:hypothetical protein
MSTTALVPVYVNDFQIGHVSSDKDFKAGLTFSYYVKVTRPDGKPMIDKENPVKVSVFYGFDDTKKTDLTFMLNDKGMAFVSVTAPLSALLLDFEVINFFKLHSFVSDYQTFVVDYLQRHFVHNLFATRQV